MLAIVGQPANSETGHLTNDTAENDADLLRPDSHPSLQTAEGNRLIKWFLSQNVSKLYYFWILTFLSQLKISKKPFLKLSRDALIARSLTTILSTPPHPNESV